MRIATAFVAALVLGACILAIQLDIKVERSSVQIEMPVLGEYPSAMSRLRISEVQSGSTLWEVRSMRFQPIQLFRLEFKVGDNPVSLLSQSKWAKSHIVAPRNRPSSSFVEESSTGSRSGTSPDGERPPEPSDFQLEKNSLG